jgi:hypothetical protein
MSQGYKNKGGIKVKTPWADPQASTEEVQNARVKEACIQDQLSSPPAFVSTEP